LLQKETPELIPPQYVKNVAKEGVQNTHHCFGAIYDATDEWLPQ